jgi:hypothetical protein
LVRASPTTHTADANDSAGFRAEDADTLPG